VTPKKIGEGSLSPSPNDCRSFGGKLRYSLRPFQLTVKDGNEARARAQVSRKRHKMHCKMSDLFNDLRDIVRYTAVFCAATPARSTFVEVLGHIGDFKGNTF